MSDIKRARNLIREFKGDRYLYGSGVLKQVGAVAASAGKRAALVISRFPGVDEYLKVIRDSLRESKVDLVGEFEGAGPNCPREDLFRITDEIRKAAPELVISFGGGSTIDAAKAAGVLRSLGGNIDSYFGTGRVTETLEQCATVLNPHIAIQTAASSAAHLTKYSNITDVHTGQKMLIVDEAIIPSHPMFDHTVTYSSPDALTIDGALDGIAHVLEVLYGSVGKPHYDKMKDVARTAISLVLYNLPKVLDHPSNTVAREALCLATDLGGYAIMLGGTNGGHLTSFSLVDILSHGRACAIMNPYYSVFFAPAIEDSLYLVGTLFQKAGFSGGDLSKVSGRDLGLVVANSMFAFYQEIGFPTKLSEVDGFTEEHILRAIEAAKNPQLRMKLENMPIPLRSDIIDEYMKPILESARDGELSRIRNV